MSISSLTLGWSNVVGVCHKQGLKTVLVSLKVRACERPSSGRGSDSSVKLELVTFRMEGLF